MYHGDFFHRRCKMTHSSEGLDNGIFMRENMALGNTCKYFYFKVGFFNKIKNFR